jgi:glutathione S-transferase
VIWLGFVTVAALLEYMVFGELVARARVKYKVEAPATTGDAIFERYFRVHQNTLETLVVFIPAMWLFAQYVNLAGAVLLGVLFIAARIVYAAGYVKDPGKRGPGAIMTAVVNAILLIGSLIGLIIYVVV